MPSSCADHVHHLPDRRDLLRVLPLNDIHGEILFLGLLHNLSSEEGDLQGEFKEDLDTTHPYISPCSDALHLNLPTLPHLKSTLYLSFCTPAFLF